MNLTKKQITTLLLLLGLIVGIFLTIYLVKQRQEIRPRALQGKANLLLSAGNTSPKVGDSFDVLVSLQLTDASVHVSGADIVLLYDKSRLQVVNLLPQVPGVDPNAAFTDAPIVTYNGDYPVGTDNPDDTFNFARVSLVARKTTPNLAQGTVSLARVTFRALNTGTATIKFPDDDSLLQVVGYGAWTPTITPPIPTVTPGGPTLTPTPGVSNTPVPPTDTPPVLTDTPPEIPTDTPPVPTDTPEPPTDTPPEIPTDTPPEIPTDTPEPTNPPPPTPTNGGGGSTYRGNCKTGPTENNCGKVGPPIDDGPMGNGNCESLTPKGTCAPWQTNDGHTCFQACMQPN